MLPLSAQPPSLLTSKNEFYFKLYYVTRFFYFNCEHFLFVYIIKQKPKKFADFIKEIRGFFFKFNENRILLEANFCLIIY